MAFCAEARWLGGLKMATGTGRPGWRHVEGERREKSIKTAEADGSILDLLFSMTLGEA